MFLIRVGVDLFFDGSRHSDGIYGKNAHELRSRICNISVGTVNANEKHCIQSFQVEGPQNREISLFIGITIGIFFRELFKAEKQLATAAIM